MMRAKLPEEYEILELLGEGSNGLVYLVRDTRDGRRYAAKEFPVTGEAAQRFFRELSILFSLHHPHIIRCANLIYGGSATNFLLLEYARGGSLRKLLAANPHGLGEEETFRLAKQMASALAAAHSSHIIHCDLKPDNILIDTASDGSQIYKLTDLGIAFHMARDAAPKSCGTPLYMAPEQFFDSPVPASDLYSLGVVLYECLVGKPPFSGGAEQLFIAHQQSEPDLAALPAGPWRNLIGRLLAKMPSARPMRAEDILDTLDSFGASPDAPLPAAASSRRAPRPSSERPETPVGPPLAAPGALAIFDLGDEKFLYAADANSIDSYDPETRAVRRQVWVGKYGCSAVAEESGDAMMLISQRLWVRRAGSPAFRMVGTENLSAESACAHPGGRFFVLADRMRISAVSPSGTGLWSAECPNYFLHPVLLCLNDGRVLVGSGPASPSVNIFSSAGEPIARFPLPGPLLALAPGGGEGPDATGIVQGLSAEDPAKLVEISPGGIRVLANAVRGVFRASWNGSFFSLLTCRREMVTLDRDGADPVVRALPADPLADARCGPYYAVLEKPGGPAVIQIFRLAKSDKSRPQPSFSTQTQLVP